MMLDASRYARYLPPSVVRLVGKLDLASMASSIGVKVLMVLINFTLITLAARALNTHDFGLYSVLFSAAGLLYIAAAGGQELFILRSWSEISATRDAARLKGALRFTGSIALIGTLVVGSGFLIWAQSRVESEEAYAALAYLVLGAWLQITVHLVRTELGVVRGDGLNNSISGAVPIVYLIICLTIGVQASIGHLFVALALGNAISLVVQLILAGRRIALKFPDLGRVKAISETREWFMRSAKFWLSSTLEAVNQYIDVIVIAYLMDPTTAGAYFVTVRLANLFAAAADAINLYTTRHLPGLLYREDREALSRMLDNVAWLTLGFIVLGMVGILIGGYFVLMLINQAYTAYFPELLVLCVGTAALAAGRSSAISLMLSGHEGRYLNITALFVPIRVVGLVILGSAFGVMGAVAVSAACFFVQSLVLRKSAASLVGFDPSIFRLLPGYRNR
jgi:O-antigen/teichoic acid export membrane protein